MVDSVVVVVVAVVLAIAARDEAEGTNSGEEAVIVPGGNKCLSK